MPTELERLVVSLEANIKQYEAALAKAQNTTATKFRAMENEIEKSQRTISQKMGAMGKRVGGEFTGGLTSAMKGAGAAMIAAFAIDKVVSAVHDSVQRIAGLGDFSEDIGVSAEAIQVFRAQMVQAGGSSEDLDAALVKIVDQAKDADSKLTKLFKANNLDASKMSIEQIIRTFLDLIAHIDDASDRMRTLGDVVGTKMAAKMMEMARGGEAAFKATAGSITYLTDEEIKAIQDVDTAWNTKTDNMQRAFDAFTAKAIMTAKKWTLDHNNIIAEMQMGPDAMGFNLANDRWQKYFEEQGLEASKFWTEFSNDAQEAMKNAFQNKFPKGSPWEKLIPKAVEEPRPPPNLPLPPAPMERPTAPGEHAADYRKSVDEFRAFWEKIIPMTAAQVTELNAQVEELALSPDDAAFTALENGFNKYWQAIVRQSDDAVKAIAANAGQAPQLSQVIVPPPNLPLPPAPMERPTAPGEHAADYRKSVDEFRAFWEKIIPMTAAQVTEINAQVEELALSPDDAAFTALENGFNKYWQAIVRQSDDAVKAIAANAGQAPQLSQVIVPASTGSQESFEAKAQEFQNYIATVVKLSADQTTILNRQVEQLQLAPDAETFNNAQAVYLDYWSKLITQADEANKAFFVRGSTMALTPDAQRFQAAVQVFQDYFTALLGNDEEKAAAHARIVEAMQLAPTDNVFAAALDKFRNYWNAIMAMVPGSFQLPGIQIPGIGAGADLGATIGKSFLDVIAQREGATEGYNTVLGHGAYGGAGANLTGMTLDQVYALGREIKRSHEAATGRYPGSSALGRYQIVGTTMRDLQRQLGLSGNTLFSPAVQDRMARELLRQTGGNPAAVRSTWEGMKPYSDRQIQQMLQQGPQQPAPVQGPRQPQGPQQPTPAEREATKLPPSKADEKAEKDADKAEKDAAKEKAKADKAADVAAKKKEEAAARLEAAAATEKEKAAQDSLNASMQMQQEIGGAITDAAKQFAHALIAGEDASKALSDALLALGQRLMDMAIDIAFKSLFGSLAGAGAGGGAGGLGALLGLAEGGSFEVKGKPGRDKNFVPLKLSRGEIVNVIPADKARAWKDDQRRRQGQPGQTSRMSRSDYWELAEGGSFQMGGADLTALSPAAASPIKPLSQTTAIAPAVSIGDTNINMQGGSLDDRLAREIEGRIAANNARQLKAIETNFGVFGKRWSQHRQP